MQKGYLIDLWYNLKRYAFTFFHDRQKYKIKTGPNEMYMAMLAMSFDDWIAVIKIDLSIKMTKMDLNIKLEIDFILKYK